MGFGALARFDRFATACQMLFLVIVVGCASLFMLF